MSAPWQRRARLLIAIVAVTFAVILALTARQRTPLETRPPVDRTDPKAIIEVASGQLIRLNRDREEIRIKYEHMLSYQDGSSRLLGVEVVTTRSGGRTFVITSKEARVGHGESEVGLTGEVQMTASDGLVLRTEQATYQDADGVMRADGPVAFSRGRMNGTGVGMTYDKNRDLLTILDQVRVQVAADDRGENPLDIASSSAVMNRPQKTILFDRGFKAARRADTFDADSGVANLSDNEERLERLDLRGNARIANTAAAPGALEAMSGHEITLDYTNSGGPAPGADRPAGAARPAASGASPMLRQANVAGTAVLQLAGDGERPGRRIEADAIDLAMSADGTTPVSLSARERVTLSMPGEDGGIARTIRARRLESRGDDENGLTSAQFTGGIEFDERGAEVNRSARSASLDAGLSSGFGTIEDATFKGAVRFSEKDLQSTSTEARYLLSRGVLELTGPSNAPPPHLINQRISVTASRIDVTLEGPLVKAAGTVKSELQPASSGSRAGGSKSSGRTPSMLDPDRIVTVTADDLDYDGTSSRATYSGNAGLWQGDTSIKGKVIEVDDRTGDLTSSGDVTTTTVLLYQQTGGKKDRTVTIATSKDFHYEEESRRARYTGEAHMNGPQGDLKGDRIDLFLKPSGNEVDRVEAFDKVLLTEGGRTTKGDRLTYFSADERYLVTGGQGGPVSLVNECGRETIGWSLTFFKTLDRVVVDGNEQIRTQSRGGSKCK
jgi:LPS export ABC transporter protein LptC/lipopolysaccharide transport protein LptA